MNTDTIAKVALVNLVILICGIFSFVALGQQVGHAQDTNGSVTNAIQDQRIDQLERDDSTAKVKLEGLDTKLAELNGTINRFIGIGIGATITLTVMQTMQLILHIFPKPKGGV